MGSEIVENLNLVRKKVELALKRSNRNGSGLMILPVSKNVDIDKIETVCKLGYKTFGESRVQEALSKCRYLRGIGVAFHMIGKLQANKIDKAIEIFDLIHSVDSFHLMEKIDRSALKKQIVVKALLQINISKEKTKSGADIEDAVSILKEAEKLENIKIVGLMAIPARSDNPEHNREPYKEMENLRQRIKKIGLRQSSMDQLSIGMTDDYHVAIEEGASIVRIGTGIFGTRGFKNQI